jgi:hypothetical protein
MEVLEISDVTDPALWQSNDTTSPDQYQMCRDTRTNSTHVGPGQGTGNKIEDSASNNSNSDNVAFTGAGQGSLPEKQLHQYADQSNSSQAGFMGFGSAHRGMARGPGGHGLIKLGAIGAGVQCCNSFAMSGARQQATMLPTFSSLSKSLMSSMSFAFDVQPDWFIEPSPDWWLKPQGFEAEGLELPMYVAYPCYPPAMCEESSGKEYAVMKRFADFMQGKWPEYGRAEGECLPFDSRMQVKWA